jgi:hypothetical protein
MNTTELEQLENQLEGTLKNIRSTKGYNNIVQLQISNISLIPN